MANALGLRNIVRNNDSNGYRADYDDNVEAQVDQNYEDFITNANSGAFTSRWQSLQEGAITLTYELNNFTVSEAMKYYDQLQGVFKCIVLIGAGYNYIQSYPEMDHALLSFELHQLPNGGLEQRDSL